MKLLSNLFLIVAFAVFIVLGIRLYNRFAPNRLSFNISFENTKKVHTNLQNPPDLLVIKKLGIKLPIYQAVVSKDKWETTEKGASYMTSTPVPGDEGNSVIYGHNWQSLLGKLISIQKGDIILIRLKDGAVKKFEADGIVRVSPDQTRVLGQSKERRLTIYTCTGFFDTQRFVASAHLIK